MSFEQSQPNSKTEFSFHLATFQNESVKRYQALRNDLKSMDSQSLLQLTMEWLQENDQLKVEFVKIRTELNRSLEEVASLKELVREKRECIKNLEKNNKSVDNNNSYNKKTENGQWQSKYRSLSTYMEEYIAQTNEVQQQFKRNYNVVKTENTKLLEYQKQMFNELNTMKIKNAQICSEFSQTLKFMQEFRDIKIENEKELDQMKDINEEIKGSISKIENSADKNPLLEQQNQEVYRLRAQLQQQKQKNSQLLLQIARFDQKKMQIQQQIEELTRQNLQIRKFQNDQTEKFLRQLQSSKMEIESLKQQLRKNQNIRPAQQLNRSTSTQKLTPQKRCHIPPLNIAGRINNIQNMQIQIPKRSMGQFKHFY